MTRAHCTVWDFTGPYSEVQKRPGLYAHPPSPDGRRDAKLGPPPRSSDSVRGRRCSPPRPLPLPPHSFLPSAAPCCLMTATAPTGLELRSCTIPSQANWPSSNRSHHYHLGHQQTKVMPISQTPDDPCPPARPSVSQSVVPKALMLALPPPTRCSCCQSNPSAPTPSGYSRLTAARISQIRTDLHLVHARGTLTRIEGRNQTYTPPRGHV